MTGSKFVFGLVSLVATSCATSSPPKHPLCNGDGSPACGNIGQAGRPEQADPPAPKAVTVVRPVVGVSAQVVAPDRTSRYLLAAPNREQQMQVDQPLVNNANAPMCGNVMTKGGPERRRCK